MPDFEASKAFHGGAFFNVIGTDFSSLDRRNDVISADVLDAWYDPSPRVLSKIREHLDFSLKTSPPTYSSGLIKTISEVRGIDARQIIVGGGSSDLMFSLFPRVLKRGERVVTLDPMYGEYAHIFTDVIGADVLRYKLNKDSRFCVDLERFERFIFETKPKIVSIVNPNSPTGRYWEKEDILKLCSRFRDTLFTVDEAYIDYAGKEKSLEKSVGEHPNLIVIKSMSKVYALSGARVAYMVCSSFIHKCINQFIPPWSVSLIGQIAGVEALKDESYYLEKYEETHVIRRAMVEKVSKVNSVRVFESCANFFLLELYQTKADTLLSRLQSKGLFIRQCDSMSVQFQNNFVRIAVKDAVTSEGMIKKIITEIL